MDKRNWWSWIATAGVLLTVAIYLSPIFTHPYAQINDDPYRYHDYLQQATYDYLFRQSILEHHQFPLRTHMLGGGYPLIANPQDVSFSPFALTTLVFGEAVGMKINILLFFLIGAAGILLLMRKGLDIPWHGAAFAAIAYCFSSWWASRVEWGFYFKLYFHLFPLAFYLYLKARKETRYLLLCAMALTVVVTQLGLGFVIIFLFLFCFELIDWLSKIKREKRPLFVKRIVALAVIVLLLGAARIFPMVKLVSENPRKVGSYSEYEQVKHPYPNFYRGIPHFAYALAFYDPTPNYPINPGWFTLALAAAGVAFTFRKSWRYLAVTGLFIAFAFGPFFPVDLWRPLFNLPMFSSMHQPYQLTNYFVLFGIIILAGYGFSLFQKIPDNRIRFAAAIVPFVFLIQPWMNNRHVYENTFTKPVPKLTVEKEFYQIKGQNMNRGAPRSLHSQQYYNVVRNVGTIDWDGDVLLDESAAGRFLVDNKDNVIPNPDYKGEAYLLGREGKPEVEFTPNKITVQVDSVVTGSLVINQNYDSAWKIKGGGEVGNHMGLVSVELNKGHSGEFILVYRPALTFIGILISLASWIGAVVFLVRKKGK